MIPVEDAETLRAEAKDYPLANYLPSGVQALRAEAKALRAEVREVVAILENWTQTADRNHAGGRVRAPPGGIRPDDGPAGGAGADETWSRL